jgi:hypothetical protein
MCKGNACSAKVVGQIHRELGVVAIAGLKKTDEGKQHFVEALKADPTVQLDPDLTTPEIQAAFDEAKGGGVLRQSPRPQGRRKRKKKRRPRPRQPKAIWCTSHPPNKRCSLRCRSTPSCPRG